MAKELNNLEKALSAIAKNTKIAKDNAAEAKEMAAPAKITTAVNSALSEVAGGRARRVLPRRRAD